MNKVRRKPSLNVLLTRYDFGIDYESRHSVIVKQSDILLSAIGLIDKSNYLYVVRPAELDKDWKIYRMCTKTIGLLPGKLTRSDTNIKSIVKSIKELIS